jgi:hypothetical protein
MLCVCLLRRYLCHQEHQPENVAFFTENNIRVYQCPIDGNKVRRESVAIV